jgi:hypothetical protein
MLEGGMVIRRRYVECMQILDNLRGNVQYRETGNIGYTRHITKTNKTKNTTQYVVDTTIHQTQDEDKQNKNTTQYVSDTTIHQTQDENKQNKNTT